MTTTIEILVAARELLSDEKRWTKGNLAHDVDGRHVHYSEPEAVSWCLQGACYKSTVGQLDGPEAWAAREHLLDEIPYGTSFGVFNDSPDTTHVDVLRVLDAAIERAKS